MNSMSFPDPRRSCVDSYFFIFCFLCSLHGYGSLLGQRLHIQINNQWFHCSANAQATAFGEFIHDVIPDSLGTIHEIRWIPKNDQPLGEVQWYISIPSSPSIDFFSNGFQSWSTSTLLRQGERMPQPGRITQKLTGSYGESFHRSVNISRRIPLSWSFTYLQNEEGDARFYGSLDEFRAFTAWYWNRKRSELIAFRDWHGRPLSAGDTLVLFRYWEAEGEPTALMKRYGQKMAGSHLQAFEMEPHPLPAHAAGYTSWYHYFTGIHEDSLRLVLKAMASKQVPARFFQIDDGYQQAVGDWLKVNSRFPSGMKKIADEIREAGYEPGIWIAPSIAEKKSELVKNHPDWLIRDAKGKPVRVGINPLWSGAYYALDVAKPGVKEYICGVLDSIYNHWGYSLVKIDFLFATAAYPPEGMTGGEAMADLMRLIRQCAGDGLLLGCGVPLGSALGMVDFCRIGSDIHLKWEHRLLKWAGMRERLSTKNSLTSTLGRWGLMDGGFVNDPDVFMLRHYNQKLRTSQKDLLHQVNVLAGGLVFTSDPLHAMHPEDIRQYGYGFPLPDVELLEGKPSRSLNSFKVRINNHSTRLFINLDHRAHQGTIHENSFEPESGRVFEAYEKIKIYKHQLVRLYPIDCESAICFLGTEGRQRAMVVPSFLQISGHHIQIEWFQKTDEDDTFWLSIPNGTHPAYELNGRRVIPIQKEGYQLLKVGQ